MAEVTFTAYEHLPIVAGPRDVLLDVCVLSASGPDDAILLPLAATEGAHLGMPGVLTPRAAR